MKACCHRTRVGMGWLRQRGGRSWTRAALLLAGVLVCTAAAAGGVVEGVPFGGGVQDVEGVSSSSNSSSSAEQGEAPKAWERHGGFVLYFVVVVYICLGFELLISLSPFFFPSAPHPQPPLSQPQTEETLTLNPLFPLFLVSRHPPSLTQHRRLFHPSAERAVHGDAPVAGLCGGDADARGGRDP